MAEILRKIILIGHICRLWYSMVFLSKFISPSFENSATPDNSVISDDSSDALKYNWFRRIRHDFYWASFYVTYLNSRIQENITAVCDVKYIMSCINSYTAWICSIRMDRYDNLHHDPACYTEPTHCLEENQ